ncbi:MAG: glycosyltransferase, partial [Chitinophagaceae bacterium]|nr:glycosyltransferase [Chitinophagaceae bacterium]
ASFFLVGYEAENNIPLVKRIFREGHEIGNHTFTHPNMAKVSKQRAGLEMDATRLLIECITGHSTIMFRAPFNADSEPGVYEELAPVALSRAKNYLTIGESIDPEDWQMGEVPNFNADTIFNRIVKIYERRTGPQEDVEDTSGINGGIILLHDAGGDRSETVKATGMIIRYFQSKGYKFTTVADLLGKKPDDLMPPVPRDKGYYWLQFNYVLAEIGYLGGQFFTSLFIVFLVLSVIRLLIVGIWASLQKRKEKAIHGSTSKHLDASIPFMVSNMQTPLVSIIVPAYNEEINAIKSLQNLLQCTYPEFEIIFVDDGSSDATYQHVKTAFAHEPLIKVFTKQNGGKASALNYGIGHSHADFVVCIDADTKLSPDAVTMLMRNFFLSSSTGNNDKAVGAVAGIVKVGNEVNLLTKWQSIEYITSQNFDRRGFAYPNAITVVPGAIGAFKKDALIEAGGFTTDTLAEDCDITIRILKAGYKVANEPKAIAYTEAPETLKQFMKQRNRWSFGVMQTFWKHKDSMFNSKSKALGWIALPDILLFKYIVPFFTPLADFFMVVGLLTGNAGKIGMYYLLFMVIDVAIAAMAFAFEKENPWKLMWLLPQRLVYRWLMMVVLFKAFRRAIKGELQQWGVLKRTGNVKEV